MKPIIKKCTLSDAEIEYIKKNYLNQSSNEMARNLNLTKSIVYEHLKFLGLQNNHPRTVKREPVKKRKGMFDEVAYAKTFLI